MRLFLKHLSRSIRKRPLQPIIIVATIILTILSIVTALEIKRLISEELRLGENSRIGNADIVISATPNSHSTFTTEEIVEEILGEGTIAVGSYEFLFTYENDTLLSKVVDFCKVEEMFDFGFVEYEEIHEEDLKNTIIITEDFAKKHSLSIGETVPLTLFGEKNEYKISAISEKPIFYSCDAMIDIRGFMDIVAKSSPVFSVLEPETFLVNTIFVTVKDGANVSESLEILKNAPEFYGSSVNTLGRMNESKFVVAILPIILNICIFLLMACGGSIIFSCFYVLSKKRKEENEAFLLSGAKKSMLDFMQIFEVLVYWVIGAPIGILLTFPVFYLMQKYLGFKFVTMHLTPKSAIISVGLMLLTSIFTVSLFIFIKNSKKKEKKASKIATSIIISLTLVSALLTLISFGNLRIPFSFPTVVLVLVCLIFTACPAFLYIVSLAIRIIEKRQQKGKQIKMVSLYYALKNSYSVKVLPNMARLISILFSVVTCAALIIGATNGHIKSTAKMLEGDFLILNDNKENFKSECLDEIHCFYKSSCLYDNGFSTMLLSCDSKEAFSSNWDIERLPKGKEIIMSSTDAKMHNVGVGDKITLKIEDCAPTEFEIIDVVNMGTMAIIFDREYFGFSNVMMIANAKPGQEEEALAEITSIAADDMIVVTTVDAFQSRSLERNTCLLKCATLLLLIIIFFSVVGFINNLYETNRTRKEEFELYHYAGLSKKGRIKMVLWEIFIMLFVGCLLGVLASLVILPSLERALNQIHFELFGYFSYAFK